VLDRRGLSVPPVSFRGNGLQAWLADTWMGSATHISISDGSLPRMGATPPPVRLSGRRRCARPTPDSVAVCVFVVDARAALGYF
jgi:hypothetical protein